MTAGSEGVVLAGVGVLEEGFLGWSARAGAVITGENAQAMGRHVMGGSGSIYGEVGCMGIDYSYEIFVPARNVARALTELAELAPRTSRRPRVAVTLPGGDQVVLPFTSHFRSEPVDCSTSSTLDLDTTIMFGVDDDAMRELSESHDWKRDERGRLAIGYIYLTVRFVSWWHPGYASLDFTAAATGMSLAFERSASIRGCSPLSQPPVVGCAACSTPRGPPGRSAG